MLILRIAWFIAAVLVCQAAADEDNRPGGRYDNYITYDVRLYGTIESMPEHGYAGTWIVNGRRIVVTDDAVIRTKYGVPVAGAYVEVEGHYTGTELTVHKIDVKRNKP